MIAPTPKLKQVIDLFPNQKLLCERVEIDDAYLSRVLNAKQSPSTKVMEKVCRFLNWPLSAAWIIVDGTEPTKE